MSLTHPQNRLTGTIQWGFLGERINLSQQTKENTMEINITSLLTANQFELSHSVMEGGSNAGAVTWQNAKERAEEIQLLDTPEKIEAFKDWVADSGAWDKDERDSWGVVEVNALFLQWVAGDCRELGADTLENIDWDKAEKDQEAGRCSSNLFRAEPGEVYFSLCH